MAVDVKKFQSTESVNDGSSKGWFSGFTFLAAALVLALSAGALTGVLASYYLNNSRYSVEVSALATYRPPQVTTIYADDGETILAEFALEKRIPLKIQDVPEQVTDALLAIEDYRYRDHIGIDPYRIVGVVFKNLTSGKTEGASTITQQLAKNLFLYKDKTYTRKVNEWAVALQIERLYTKDQILEMYMNYVFLGAGAYGFEAGSRTYFGKSVKDLTLEEAALLAAIPKSPESAGLVTSPPPVLGRGAFGSILVPGVKVIPVLRPATSASSSFSSSSRFLSSLARFTSVGIGGALGNDSRGLSFMNGIIKELKYGTAPCPPVIPAPSDSLRRGFPIQTPVTYVGV